MKVTVEANRKSVIITHFGQAPFAVDDDGKVVPSGFTVRTKVNKRWWIASTRVSPETLKVEYRFVCEDNPKEGTGGWSTSPTGAFEDASGPNGLNDARHHRGTNGALLIGVKYPRLQLAIREHFGFNSTALAPQRPPRKMMRMEEEEALNEQSSQSAIVALEVEPIKTSWDLSCDVQPSSTPEAVEPLDVSEDCDEVCAPSEPFLAASYPTTTTLWDCEFDSFLGLLNDDEEKFF